MPDGTASPQIEVHSGAQNATVRNEDVEDVTSFDKDILGQGRP